MRRLGSTMHNCGGGEISIPWSGGVTSVYEIHSSNINIKEVENSSNADNMSYSKRVRTGEGYSNA